MPPFRRNLYAQIYRSPEGEGEGGGGGGGDNKAEQRLAALEQAIQLMAQANAGINEAMTTMATKLDALATGAASHKENSGGSGDDDVDLETLDRKSFAAYMTGQMTKIVQDAMKPLGDAFGKLDEKIDGTSLNIMIKDFQKDHPDFFEWKDEMKNILKQNPTLTPARAYALARAEADKGKLAKIDEKYGLGKPESKNGSEKDILSFFPNGGNSSATKTGNQKMDPKTAALAAWDSVMSQLPS